MDSSSTLRSPTDGKAGRPFAFTIAFVAAIGGFLIGYDIAVIAGASTLIFPVLTGHSEKYIGSQGGALWFYAAVCVLSAVFGFTLMPETKDKSLEEFTASWTKV